MRTRPSSYMINGDNYGVSSSSSLQKKRDLLAITSDRLSALKDKLWVEVSLPSPSEEVAKECDRAFTVFLFANSKCKRYFHNRLKPSKLTWTAVYRKQHKKERIKKTKDEKKAKKPNTDVSNGKQCLIICTISNWYEEKEAEMNRLKHNAKGTPSPTFYRGQKVVKSHSEKETKFLKFVVFKWNHLSWVMEAATIMAIALANGGLFCEITSASRHPQNEHNIKQGLNQPAGVHTLTEKAKMAFYFKYDWQEHAACLKD
ncbi:hypothetical protein JHK82_051161 [Glycine max]|nr:hypothetical protein JHK82_051161 [Glycine max]